MEERKMKFEISIKNFLAIDDALMFSQKEITDAADDYRIDGRKLDMEKDGYGIQFKDSGVYLCTFEDGSTEYFEEDKEMHITAVDVKLLTAAATSIVLSFVQ